MRGPERIRTAVAAFAELSLAARPQDLDFLHCKSKAKYLLSQINVKLNGDIVDSNG
jgi:hypothetical protein